MLVLWACIAKLAAEECTPQLAAGCPTLTIKPRRLIKPIYPDEALRLGIRGTVIAALLIDKQGLPQNIRVTRGDATLASSVLKAVQKWRWHPYRLNRQPVEIEMTIAVNFEPANDASLAPEPAFALCRW